MARHLLHSGRRVGKYQIRRADAVIVPGLSDTAGTEAPTKIAANILGDVDVASAHPDHYSVAGGSLQAGANAQVEIVRHRLRSPDAPILCGRAPNLHA